MTPLKQWMKIASPDEQKRLAVQAKTSRAYLYILCADDEKNYRRSPGLDLAARIEETTKVMNEETNGRLPVVYRTDLVPGCASCPYAMKCAPDLARRADFPILQVREA
jgi:hypothetical protein